MIRRIAAAFGLLTWRETVEYYGRPQNDSEVPPPAGITIEDCVGVIVIAGAVLVCFMYWYR